MNYVLSIDGEYEEFDNSMAYFLKIQKLRGYGYNIEYETAEGKVMDQFCHATSPQ